MKKKIAIATFALGIIFGVFLAPASSVLAQTPATNNPYSTEFEAQLQTCTTENWTITGCLLEAYYNVILYPSSWLAYMTGSIFDYFIAYSLDTASYNGATSNEFVNKGWAIMRDIANVLFIFALLYVAIKHILQAAGSETKKFLKSIIIAALLINFSLFFTKVIIDAGNILARAFYNNIEVTNDDGADHKTISQALVEKVSPQKILSTNLFKPRYGPGLPPGTLDPGWTFLIMLVVTIVNVVIALTFLSTFLLFAARVIGLWFMMIFSPLAFASIAIPGASNFFGDFGWGKWLKQTLSLSFMAPVFLFFLFLLIMFLDIAFSSTVPTGDQSSIQQLMFVFIPFIAIIVILNMAKAQAKEMAGKAGEAVTKFAGTALGFVATGAMGLATGGVGAIGRGVIGRGTAHLSKKKWFQNAASNNRFARQLYKVNDAASKSSFDFRNTAVGQKTTGFMSKGLATAGFASADNFTKGTTKGGYTQRVEEYQKRKEEFTKNLKVDEHVNQNLEYEHVDDKGNKTKRIVNKSKIEAETDFLEAKNETSKKDVQKAVPDGKGGTTIVSADYEGWKKQKEKAEKDQKQAEADYSTAGTPAAKAQAQRDIANNKARVSSINKVIKDDFESKWKREEEDFKALNKSMNAHNTQMLKQYANSVQSTGLTRLYDLATGHGGVGNQARSRASAETRRKAQKSEEKDQKEESKDKK